jgi:hypothetical protein
MLAGCGVSQTIDPIAAAATKTEKAGGVKVAMTMGVTAGGRSFSIDANGAFDGGNGELTMNLSSVLGAAGSNGAAEMRFIEESGHPVIYLNMPFLAGEIPGGASWLRLDLDQAGKALGVDVSRLVSQAGQNPADALDMLRAAGSVDEVGTETLAGGPTTHYKASIDLAKAVDKLPERVQQAVQRLIDQGAPSVLPVDVWIGDDGLVRKLTMDESLPTAGSTGQVRLSMTFSDYGTPVNVVAPPADQTLDLSGMIGALSRAGTTTH